MTSRIDFADERARMSPIIFSAIAIVISAFAIWHRSVIGWIVAAGANLAAMWLMWPTL